MVDKKTGGKKGQAYIDEMLNKNKEIQKKHEMMHEAHLQGAD